MSGDRDVPVVVLAQTDQTRQLLGALDELTSAEIGFVLVGGLGVMARLGTVHRATSDLDAGSAHWAARPPPR